MLRSRNSLVQSACSTPRSIPTRSTFIPASSENSEDGHGLRKTKWNKNVFLVGVTLLHELVHWADNLDGIDFPDEEGEQFETDVYGMVINE